MVEDLVKSVKAELDGNKEEILSNYSSMNSAVFNILQHRIEILQEKENRGGVQHALSSSAQSVVEVLDYFQKQIRYSQNYIEKAETISNRVLRIQDRYQLIVDDEQPIMPKC